jgi:cell division protein FtsQ
MTTPTPETPEPQSGLQALPQPDEPAALEIDPRIEARRDEVRRAHTRKRARILVIVAVIVVLLTAIYLTINSPFLAVDHIEVTGAVHVPAAQVRAASGVGMHHPLLRVDTALAASRVEQLPWVALAHVTRHLPNTLRIEIVEARPLAYVRVHGRDTLIDANGRAIAVVASAPAGALPITGVKTAPALHQPLVPTGLGAVVDAIPPTLRTHARALAVGPTSLTLVLDHGAILLGNASAPTAKFAAADAVIANLGGKPFQYVDVTDPPNPVARP